MLLDPAIGTLLIASVAFLFASAALHKLRDFARFKEIFAAYELVPGSAAGAVAWLVPALEAAVAIGLCLARMRAFAAVLASVVLLTYAGAIAVNLGRGRRDLACGCGGPNDRRPIAAWMIWRNVLVAAAAAAGMVAWSGRALALTDMVTIAFGLLTTALMYLCVDQLFGNSGRAGIGRAR
jgi:uncharacterized membrane protein YphA (DoxX/SURF4 family)